MTVNFAMGRRAGLPGKGRRSGHVNYARPAEQVGLGSAFDKDGDFFVVGPTETKGYASIGANLRRDQRRRWRLRRSGTGHAGSEEDSPEPNGKEQVGEPKASTFHDSP